MTNYQEIISTEALAEVLASSEQQPVLIFKHSMTCGLSSRAFGEFERYLQAPESSQVRNFIIVIQKARRVSDELARSIGIQHESPQAIIVRGGRAVWADSHLALKSGTLIAAVRQN
jgi:bacillithiol system protein YtxJ